MPTSFTSVSNHQLSDASQLNQFIAPINALETLMDGVDVPVQVQLDLKADQTYLDAETSARTAADTAEAAARQAADQDLQDQIDNIPVGLENPVDYLDLASGSNAPAADHTLPRVTYDGTNVYVYLPSGKALQVKSNVAGPVVYFGADGTIQVFGTRQIQGLDVIDPNGYLHINGGVYVGETNSPTDPGTQELGLHVGLRHGYGSGYGGRMLMGRHWENTTRLDHPYLATADEKTGIVTVFAPGGKFAEFLIQGGGTGTATCTITELRNYSSGTFGVASSGATYELIYESNKVRLTSGGNFDDVGMSVDIAYQP